MNRILIILTAGLALAGCESEESRQKSRDSMKRIQGEMPAGCIFRDFGDYARPTGERTRVLAVICKDAQTTTSTQWIVGKSRASAAINIDLRKPE